MSRPQRVPSSEVTLYLQLGVYILYVLVLALLLLILCVDPVYIIMSVTW